MKQESLAFRQAECQKGGSVDLEELKNNTIEILFTMLEGMFLLILLVSQAIYLIFASLVYLAICLLPFIMIAILFTLIIF